MLDASCSALLPLSDGMDYHQSSQLSMVTSSDYDFEDICRICHSEGKTDSPLISPCCCSGSLCYVHSWCLQEWIKSSDIKCCEICQFQFIMYSKFLPFWKWKKFKMTLVEKLMLIFFIIIQVVAMPILVLYLILMAESQDPDKKLLPTSMEVVDWFARIVIGMSLLVEIVLVAYQWHICLQLFRKWRNLNRLIYVQNAPNIGGTVQQQQQQAVAFSASSLLPAYELTSDGTSCLLPKESKFYKCESDSNSNIHTSNSCIVVKVGDEKDTSGELTKTKKSSTETSLTAVMENGLVPIADYNFPLGEVDVISTPVDDNSRNDNPKTIADTIKTTEKDSTETSLMATTDNTLVPVANHKCPLSEFVLASTTFEPVKGKMKKMIRHFFPSSHSKEHAEDKDLLLA